MAELMVKSEIISNIASILKQKSGAVYYTVYRYGRQKKRDYMGIFPIYINLPQNHPFFLTRGFLKGGWGQTFGKIPN